MTRAALIAVFVLLFLIGCDAKGSELEELRALDEADLRPPAGEVLETGGREADRTMVGNVRSTTWVIYGTAEPWDTVLTYFVDELDARGWTEGGGVSGIRGTHEEDVQAWTKDGIVFRLSPPMGRDHSLPF